MNHSEAIALLNRYLPPTLAQQVLETLSNPEPIEQAMVDPFELMTHDDFIEALQPESWKEVLQRLHTPKFDALLQEGQLTLQFPDGQRKQFERSDVEALTRFLTQYAGVEPLPVPLDPFADFKPTILPEPQDNGDIWLYDEDKWTRINDESTDEETRTAFTAVYEGITALDILHSLDPQELTSIQGNEQAWDDAMKQAWKAHNSLSQLLTTWDEELSDLQAEAENADPGEDEDNLDEDDDI